MAADQQLVATAALKVGIDSVGDDLEMLHGFIGDAAFDMAGVVTAPPIATAATSELVDEVELLDDYSIGNLKHSRLGAIDQCYASMLHAVEDGGKGLEMKALVEDEISLGKVGGQIELVPDVLGGTGENRLSFAPVATWRVGHFKDALQIATGIFVGVTLLGLA